MGHSIWQYLQRRSPCQSFKSASFLPRRGVALARPRLQAFPRDADVDLVDLAVAFRRRVADQILAVELVHHARERRAEILAEANLRIAGAGFLRDPREPGVRQIVE